MWHSIAIDGTTLVDALRCWEGSRYTTNRPRPVDIPMETWLPDPEYPSLNLPETNEIRGNRIRHTSGTELSREERRKLRRKWDISPQFHNEGRKSCLPSTCCPRRSSALTSVSDIKVTLCHCICPVLYLTGKDFLYSSSSLIHNIAYWNCFTTLRYHPSSLHSDTTPLHYTQTPPLFTTLR